MDIPGDACGADDGVDLDPKCQQCGEGLFDYQTAFCSRACREGYRTDEREHAEREEE
jgi:hypothetical protein